jgi:hypothetical protein
LYKIRDHFAGHINKKGVKFNSIQAIKIYIYLHFALKALGFQYAANPETIFGFHKMLLNNNGEVFASPLLIIELKSLMKLCSCLDS